ncbi:hypothetical protein ACX9NE_21650 [Mycobacterium sp. ML4]
MNALESQVLAQSPLIIVLNAILERISDDIPGVIGSSIVFNEAAGDGNLAVWPRAESSPV